MEAVSIRSCVSMAGLICHVGLNFAWKDFFLMIEKFVLYVFWIDRNSLFLTSYFGVQVMLDFEMAPLLFLRKKTIHCMSAEVVHLYSPNH